MLLQHDFLCCCCFLFKKHRLVAEEKLNQDTGAVASSHAAEIHGSSMFFSVSYMNDILLPLNRKRVWGRGP